MPVPDPIQRDYAMDDLEMFERAQVFHDNYVDDEALFAAAFPHFGLTYAADFQTKIDDADAIPSDYEVETDIVDLTAQIGAKMVTARAAMQKLFTYADVAFNDPVKTRKFGKELYEKARNSHNKMKELLELAHRRASETTYETALLAAGYTAADITELDTLKDEIHTLNAQQEDLQSDRIDKSEIRVKAYNEVWAIMDQINQASKVIFADSPAKLTQYLLYPTTHHAPAQVTGLVYDPVTGTLTWAGISGVSITYEVAFAPDMPEPIFIQIYDGADRSVVYDPGGPDNYLFKVRAKAPGSVYGEWSEVLIVVRP